MGAGAWILSLTGVCLALGFGLLIFRSATKGGLLFWLMRPRASYHPQVTSYDLSFRVPDDSTEPQEVESYCSDGKTYLVDPVSVTCTCPNAQLRTAWSQDSVARCCKHLLQVLGEVGVFADAGKWEAAILQDGHGGPAGAWLVDLKTAPAVLITVGLSREWVNVFAHTKRRGERIKEASGPIERFGWNISEKRWSYGEGPPGSKELTPIIKEIF